MRVPANIVFLVIIIIIIIIAFPQSGSASAGIQVISASDTGQASSTGEIPLLFSRSAVGSLKSPVGLAGVGRLGQWLGVLTQGYRVAQTGCERPFSLTAPESSPQLGIKPELHWWEADVPTTGPPEQPPKHFKLTDY